MPHLSIRNSVAAGALLCAAGALAQSPSFTPLPDLPGGTSFSRARALSPDWAFVVGMSNSTNGDEAARWHLGEAGATGLGDIPGGPFSSEAYACSSGGLAVFGAGTNAGGNNEAFRWTPSGGMVSLGFLPTGGYVSRAFACTADGNVACGENLFQPNGVPPPLPITQAFRWTQSGGMQPLGFLPGAGFYSTARAMSWGGDIIVGWAQDTSGVNRPFRWTAATGMEDFTAGQIVGTARGISSSQLGSYWILGSDSSTSRAYRWSPERGLEFLGVPAGFTSSIAVASSSDGRRVLAVCNGPSGQAACLWYQAYGSCAAYWTTLADQLTSSGVSTSGWRLSVALAMDWYGSKIIGYGTNPAGQTQGWVAVIYPIGQPTCRVADFNCDGDIGTDQDIADFFACLAGDCPPFPCCSSADYDEDGDIGTDADIDAFFRVLAGSC